MKLDTETRTRLTVYRAFAVTGEQPTAAEVARQVGVDTPVVLDAYARLAQQRLLVLEADGRTIRMAPPFSGMPTGHSVQVDDVEYFANCAWDAFGVLAALHQPGTVSSSCGHSGKPLHLKVGLDGPEESDWLFHSLVPAVKWWDDIVFT